MGTEGLNCMLELDTEGRDISKDSHSVEARESLRLPILYTVPKGMHAFVLDVAKQKGASMAFGSRLRWALLSHSFVVGRASILVPVDRDFSTLRVPVFASPIF